MSLKVDEYLSSIGAFTPSPKIMDTSSMLLKQRMGSGTVIQHLKFLPVQ